MGSLFYPCERRWLEGCDIIKCRRAVTSETSIRLATYFGGSPLVWLRMQAVYDLARVETEKGAAIRRSVRVAEKSM